MAWRKLACLVTNAVVVGGMCIASSLALAQSVMLESAEMGAAGRFGGSSVTVAQFVGWRFATSELLAVEQVGGHLMADPFQPGDIFAALVRLDSLSSVPHGAPFTEEEVVATTLFRPDFPSGEFFTPMSATLVPGSYALVYGTELFGATGAGALPNFDDQPDIPPTDISSFIFWSIPSLGAPMEWRQNLASHMRFVIEAETIHIPGDYDVDGEVDAEDYNAWKADFGSTDELNADGNGDSVVDAADYTVWRDQLGSSAGGGAAASVVPEPLAVAMLTQAIALMAAVRARPTFAIRTVRKR